MDIKNTLWYNIKYPKYTEAEHLSTHRLTNNPKPEG